MHRDDGVGVLEHVVGVAGNRGGRHVHLVEGVLVHKDEVLALAVQIGHVALVHLRDLDLGAGVEGLVDDLARQHVLERGPDERAALAGLDVLELVDGPQAVVELEHHAVLEVVRGGHGQRVY